MIFLLNYERVFKEIGELARAKLSEGLSTNVEISFSYDGGKVKPNIQVVLAEGSMELEEKLIKEQIADIWLNMIKPELISRLAGLSGVRIEKGSEKNC